MYTVSPKVAARYPYVLPPAREKGPHPEETVSTGKGSITFEVSLGCYRGPSGRTLAKRKAKKARGK